jgi:hypothetical protein
LAQRMANPPPSSPLPPITLIVCISCYSLYLRTDQLPAKAASSGFV